MRIAPAVLLLCGATAARAHVVAPRVDLDGFAQRAESIVRGRVLGDTRPAHPGRGAYPVLTDVAVERAWKGQRGVAAVTVLGRDEHAVRYTAGQRAIFFLMGRPGVDRFCWADQNQGEEVLVDPGEEGAWDAYLDALVRAQGEARVLAQSPTYRAAVRAALAAPAARLRAHALEAMRWRLQGAPASREDVDALLGAIRSRGLPEPARLALLGAALPHLAPADLAPLASQLDEPPRLRGALLEAWAETAQKRGCDAEREAVRTAARSALGEPQPASAHAAAALARLGDAKGILVLREALAAADSAVKEAGSRGLSELVRAGHADAATLLQGVPSPPGDSRPASGAQKPAPASLGPRSQVLWLVFGVALALGALTFSVFWWRRRAQRQRRVRRSF
jgi:hypothetical protein